MKEASLRMNILKILKNIVTENKSVAPGFRNGRATIKGWQKEGFGCDGTLLYSDCGGNYASLYMC